MRDFLEEAGKIIRTHCHEKSANTSSLFNRITFQTKIWISDLKVRVAGYITAKNSGSPLFYTSAASPIKTEITSKKSFEGRYK